MGTFILIAIAVAVIYFIFQIVDTSPVNKYYFNYTGILMVNSELSKIIDMRITVSIQDKFITINGDYYYKKMRILKRENELGDIYYDCIDDKRQKVIAISRPKHNTFLCFEPGMCIVYTNDRETINAFKDNESNMFDQYNSSKFH